MAADYYLDNDNFESLRDDLTGQYHLLENIDLQGKLFTPFGTEEAQFQGGLYGHGFAIKNFKAGTSESPLRLSGLFGAAGDNVTIEVSLENLELHGDKTGAAAAVIGDHCNVLVPRLIDVSSSGYSGPAGLIVGQAGSENSVRLGYSNYQKFSGLHSHEAAAGLVGMAGDNNRFSVGLGQAQIISGNNQPSGVLSEAGVNNTVFSTLR